MSLKGLSAIVTGAASGLGLAAAHRLANHGARVVIADLPQSNGPSVAKQLSDGLGFFHPTDVSNDDDVRAAIESTGDRLDILVNCAGIAYATKTLGKKGPHDLKQFQDTLNINVIGTFNMSRLAAEKMAQTQPLSPDYESTGVIINTASVAAFEGQIGQVAYSASKAAIVGMTLPMARDLARYGIRVNAIAPGLFDTSLLAGLPEKVKADLAMSVPFPSRL